MYNCIYIFAIYTLHSSGPTDSVNEIFRIRPVEKIINMPLGDTSLVNHEWVRITIVGTFIF